MKYIRLFENFDTSEIDVICKVYNIQNYTINPDGSIDVVGNVNLNSKRLIKIPLKFNSVSGNFSCGGNQLTNLEGTPNYVGDSFYCMNNYGLTTLKGGPKVVNGVYNCSGNFLEKLEYLPTIVKRFICSGNKLTSLVGCPNAEMVRFDDNMISTLEGLPTDSDISCYETPLDNLAGLFFHGDYEYKLFLDYQETFNFLRKDCKIIKYLLEEALKDYNEYYNKQVELPEEIEGYTYI